MTPVDPFLAQRALSPFDSIRSAIARAGGWSGQVKRPCASATGKLLPDGAFLATVTAEGDTWGDALDVAIRTLDGMRDRPPMPPRTNVVD